MGNLGDGDRGNQTQGSLFDALAAVTHQRSRLHASDGVESREAERRRRRGRRRFRLTTTTPPFPPGRLVRPPPPPFNVLGGGNKAVTPALRGFMQKKNVRSDRRPPERGSSFSHRSRWGGWTGLIGGGAPGWNSNLKEEERSGTFQGWNDET